MPVNVDDLVRIEGLAFMLSQDMFAVRLVEIPVRTLKMPRILDDLSEMRVGHVSLEHTRSRRHVGCPGDNRTKPCISAFGEGVEPNDLGLFFLAVHSATFNISVILPAGILCPQPSKGLDKIAAFFAFVHAPLQGVLSPHNDLAD